MTEIATREQQTIAAAPTSGVPATPVPAGAQDSALVLWAYEARQAAFVAESLSKTSFVPASLRGKPADITAAILAGQELGLQPMAALRSMDVIQGTPALRAHAMRGLVQSKGHKVWVVPGATAERVVMRGQRLGPDGYEEIQESEWDIERAEGLGLTGKPEWKKQPKTMLTARATGEICRLVAADVLYAMPYAAEELGEPDTPSGNGGGSARRVTASEILSQARPTPAPIGGGQPPTGSQPEPAPVSAPQVEPEIEGWPEAAVPPDAAQ